MNKIRFGNLLHFKIEENLIFLTNILYYITIIVCPIKKPTALCEVDYAQVRVVLCLMSNDNSVEMLEILAIFSKISQDWMHILNLKKICTDSKVQEIK